MNKTEKSLIPIFVTLGLLCVLLSFVIGIAIGSQLLAPDELSQDTLSSWVTAAATAAIALLTFILAVETWNLRKIQNRQIIDIRRENIRPNVVISLVNSPISFNLMNIKIDNNGKGIAKNLTFEFCGIDDTPASEESMVVIEELLKLHVIKNGLHSLGISQNITSYVFSMFDLKSKLTNELLFSPFFKIKISYSDVEGFGYTNEFVFDFKEFKGITSLGGGEPMHRLANDIEKIRKKIEGIVDSDRVRVDSYTQKDRQDRDAQIEKQFRKNYPDAYKNESLVNKLLDELKLSKIFKKK